MSLKEIIKQLSRDFNLGFSEGEEVYSLVVNDIYEVYLEKSIEPHIFLLSAPVCRIPEKGAEKAYRLLLEANLYGQEMGQHVLAIDKRSNQVVLFRWFNELEISYTEFLDHLKCFVKHVETWEEKIEQFPDHEEGEEELSDLNIRIKI
jgi:hypothetical protein